jgi:hypothetical protein
VGGQAGRFVHRKQMFVFEKHRGYGWRNDRSSPPPDTQWRYSNLIAFLQPLFHFRARFVDPNFPAANDAIDVALGDAFGQLEQKVVEPLTR